MKNFVKPGKDITLAAPYAVLSGAGALVGSIFGISATDLVITELGEFEVTGVFDIAKVSAQAWATVGLLIYWDDTAKLVTTTASTNKLIGVNVAVAANPSATGRVRLNGAFIA